MLNKIRIKKCMKHHWHLYWKAPNPIYYTSYETKQGTTIYTCKDCHEKISRNLKWIKESLKNEREKKKKNDMEKLVDKYVVKELIKGSKGLKRDKIPKSLIEIKRATLKLKRLIKKKNDPLIECKKHGSLFLKNVIKSGKGRLIGEQRYKCRECMRELHKNYYQRNKDYVLNKCSDYKKNNPDKIKEIRIKYKEKNNDKNN